MPERGWLHRFKAGSLLENGEIYRLRRSQDYALNLYHDAGATDAYVIGCGWQTEDGDATPMRGAKRHIANLYDVGAG